MVLTQATLCNLVTFLKRFCCLLVLLKEIPLQSHIMVRNRQHGIIVLREILSGSIFNTPLDKLKRTHSMLHRLVVLFELGQNLTDVQMSACKCHFIGVQVYFHLECPAKIAECSMKFAGFLII